MIDAILAVLSFLLTLMIFSYLISADNPFFKFASSAFIGVSAAYVVLISLSQVILPRLLLPLIAGTLDGQPISPQARLLTLVPLGLGLLLLTKLWPASGLRLGNVSMAYLVGAGAALAISGAVLGTLFPQSLATIQLFNLRQAAANPMGPAGQLLDGVIMLVGVLATLFYFTFTARRGVDQVVRRAGVVETLAKLGQVFIAITFGALFAGVLMSALTALVERIHFLLNFSL